ncbi:CinA family protein [Rhodosalinus sp. 5P4]|uniref:CinA family protein n=1 Tax=Rhodosalinus sp. 5P4 TaxID=3239196 RepID=UPI003524C5D5
MITQQTLVMRYRDAGRRVTTAESCTGGLLSARITEQPGSSHVFERGFVTYSNRAKQEMLGVEAETLAAQGAVSEAVAREMAEGALARAHADVAIAITGIAGPGGSETKPEGRVCFALAVEGRKTLIQTVEFGPLGRENVRRASVDHAMSMLDAVVDGAP